VVTGMTSRIDKAFLVLSGVFVAGLAVVAGAISFAHTPELATARAERLEVRSVPGQRGWSWSHRCTCWPSTGAGRRSGVLPWAALLVGTAASLAANVAVGGHDLVGRALAGWPALSLLASLVTAILVSQCFGVGLGLCDWRRAQ